MLYRRIFPYEDGNFEYDLTIFGKLVLLSKIPNLPPLTKKGKPWPGLDPGPLPYQVIVTV